MNMQKPGMLTPALVGGAVAGLLSGIPFLNCLCCLWIIGGAMLASFLLIKNSQVPLSAGDGAIVGIFSGLIAAVVEAVVSIPFHAVTNEFVRKLMEQLSQYAEDMPSGWESWLERGAAGISVTWFMLGLLISAVVFSALGALGGILGISLFGKKKPQGPKGVSDAPQDASYRQS